MVCRRLWEEHVPIGLTCEVHLQYRDAVYKCWFFWIRAVYMALTTRYENLCYVQFKFTQTEFQLMIQAKSSEQGRENSIRFFEHSVVGFKYCSTTIY